MSIESSPRLSRPSFGFILLLIAISAGVRFAAASVLRDFRAPPQLGTTGEDGVEFNLLGLRLAQGHGYTWADGQPTAFRAPGFPFLLAAIYAVFGEDYLVVYVALAMCGAVSCVGAYFLARDLAGERVGRMAALIHCVYVPDVYFATRFDSENVFMPCLAWGLWGFVRHLRTGRWPPLMLSAVLLGYSILVRPFALLVPFLLAAGWLVWRRRYPQTTLGRMAIFGAVVALTVVPWTIRNALALHEFALVATNGGATFYGSNNSVVLSDPRHWGGWISTRRLPGRDLVDAAPNEVEHDRIEWRLGVQWVRDHWTSVPILMLRKFLRFCAPDWGSPSQGYVLLQIVGLLPMYPLLVVGAYRSLKGEAGREAWVAHLALAATVVTCLIFWGSPRFRDANTPLIAFYAALGLDELLRWVAVRRQSGGRRNDPADGA